MRGLRDSEIKTLKIGGCQAENWRNIAVAENFSAENIRNTEFSGHVTLGAECRILNATLANIDIENNVLIRNIAFLGQISPSPFGNGSAIHCIAEDGARNVPMWRGLSAQWAHVILHRKASPAALALEKMIRSEAAALASDRSRVGAGSRITFSGTLENVSLGPCTVIEGATRLRDVYADSHETAPVFIGEGVAAEDCILQQQARVDGGSRLLHCLVGEGVKISNTFFAEHSLFFANSDFALGEALSTLAGPFAVSHHKATLVLTCQNSFGNFGSGSNSSNHHFKLGPRHGGILRRGVRCGSGSYLFWPADIGAFSTVAGRHARHLDTTAFPFSLLIAEGDRSVLVPGVNLFSAGLFRDELKWRSRDRRKGIDAPRDLYECAILSPYTMEAAERGLAILRRHRVSGGGDLLHNGAVIPAARVEEGIRLYEMALVYYMGRVLADRGLKLDEAAPAPEPKPVPTPCGGWRDWGGMLVSGERAEAFLRDVAEGRIADAAGVDAALRLMHGAFLADELGWVVQRWRGEHARRWRECVDFVFDRRMKDVAKEFSESVMIGFGVEGDAEESFRRVRGLAEDDPVARLMREEHDRLYTERETKIYTERAPKL